MLIARRNFFLFRCYQSNFEARLCFARWPVIFVPGPVRVPRFIRQTKWWIPFRTGRRQLPCAGWTCHLSFGRTATLIPPRRTRSITMLKTHRPDNNEDYYKWTVLEINRVQRALHPFTGGVNSCYLGRKPRSLRKPGRFTNEDTFVLGSRFKSDHREDFCAVAGKANVWALFFPFSWNNTGIIGRDRE